MIARKLDSMQRDLQRALLTAQIGALEAQRAKDLWALPVVREVYVPDMTDLPLETYQQAKRAGDGPPSFVIGRRSFVLTADLRAWLERRAKTTAPKKARRETQEPDDDNAARTTEAPTRPSFASALQAPRPSR